LEKSALYQGPVGSSFMEHLFFCARIGAYCACRGVMLELSIHAGEDSDILLAFGKIHSAERVLLQHAEEWKYLCNYENAGGFRRSFPASEADICFLKVLSEDASCLHLPEAHISKKKCGDGKTEITICFRE